MAQIITSENFTLLSVEEKVKILLKHGIFLSKIIEYGKFKLNIWELSDFFVGVFHDLDRNTIKKIEVLETDLKERLIKNISPN